MTRSRRRWWLILAATLGAAIVLLSFAGPLWREPIGQSRAELPCVIASGSEPIVDQFVGHTEANIVHRFGAPTHRWSGHFGTPSLAYRWKYSDAETAIYEQPNGTLYLSFCLAKGERVCFTSVWTSPSMVF